MTIIPTIYYFLFTGILGMLAFYSLKVGDALMTLASGG